MELDAERMQKKGRETIEKSKSPAPIPETCFFQPIVDDTDAQLDQLLQTLQSIKLLSLDIGAELQEHRSRLDTLSEEVSKALPRMDAAVRRPRVPLGDAQLNATVAPASVVSEVENPPVIIVHDHKDGERGETSKKNVPSYQNLPVDNAASTFDQDFTQVPRNIESRLANYKSVRPTIFKTDTEWCFTQKTLLRDESTRKVTLEAQAELKSSCLNILDALSMSGSLPLSDCSLHAVVPFSQFFSKTIIETVIQDNINPIQQIENVNFLLSEVVQKNSI